MHNLLCILIRNIIKITVCFQFGEVNSSCDLLGTLLMSTYKIDSKKILQSTSDYPGQITGSTIPENKNPGLNKGYQNNCINMKPSYLLS